MEQVILNKLNIMRNGGERGSRNGGERNQTIVL